VTDLQSLTPSAKFVLYVLDREGPLTRQALIETTRLPESTLDDALDTLDTRDLVHRARFSDDFRVVVCELRDDTNL